MCKVLSEFSVRKKYKVLSVNEAPPQTKYSKYKIGGKLYDPVIVYDMPLGIAIKYTKESLVGMEVEFI